LWAVLVFFVVGARGDLPLDDVTPLTPGRRWLGYTTFLILALILIPLPHSLWPPAGIQCPYA
ncbi:MAG: site-2 protease family protein, partial [Rubrobacteraceae bacterium]